MASNPPGACCFVGVKHEGTPTGKHSKIGETDVYIAAPAEGNGHKDVALLYLPDVVGIWQNSQLMADQLAANGYHTVILDTFRGDPIPVNRPADFDFAAWMAKGSTGDNPHTPEYVDPIVEEALKYLKGQGFKKIGALGYCFGAKYLCRHYRNGIDVGYVAHPSFVEEEELAAITGPLSIAAAETDPIFPVEKRHKSEEILAKTGVPWQINLFSGVTHGFAVRGDMTNKSIRFGKEQAFYQAVTWFNEYLLA